MKICVLGSGSGGNSTLIESASTRILVDLGLGPRSLQRRLREASLERGDIDAVLITHGHSDHISGLRPFVVATGVTVYMSNGTLEEVGGLDSLPPPVCFVPNQSFQIGDISVQSFPVPHDATQPVGFRFEAGGTRGALATDLGEIPANLHPHLSDCDWLILESNHDEDLVRVGSYPWELKQRVLSSWGHLSNDALAGFLRNEYDGRASHVMLAHLSRQNNLPDLARETARQALSERFPLFRQLDLGVHLTHQAKPSIVLEL